MSGASGLRPAEVCRALLGGLEASEGRRRRRPRDTTPDVIGLGQERELLAAALGADPPGEEFEAWLATYCLARGGDSGALRALARGLLAQWRLACASTSFRDWLGRGTPSADKGGG